MYVVVKRSKIWTQMTIGINGNEANVTHRVGVGQYAFELLSHFPKKDITVYLQNKPLSDMPGLNYEVFGPKKLWTLTGLQRKLLSNPPDILFTPTHYIPIYVPCPSVISIMDLGFERFPQYFKKRDLYQLRYWTRFSVKQAKKIITISEFSKSEICKIYGISKDTVVAIPLGYDIHRFHSKVSGKNKYGNYILFLGTLQPRKNIERLIEAFNRLQPTSYKLVIAGMINEGRGGWMNEKIKGSDKIILTGYVPDEEVPILMANAKAYVLPSLYEGFGIPALEAMACGTPVIVSRVSSLPEICGQAATYIEDPYDVQSIKSALEQGLKANKRELGLNWVKRYNWDTTTKKTLEVLYEAAKK